MSTTLGVEAETRIANAVIEDTMLGNEDHGIPTCYLYLSYGDGGRQGFGGYDLRHYGIKFLTEVLRISECDQWEKLRGKPVRVKISGGLVRAVGNYLRDVWYEPEGGAQ